MVAIPRFLLLLHFCHRGLRKQLPTIHSRVLFPESHTLIRCFRHRG